MRKINENNAAVFQSPRAAAKATGLSAAFVRAGCKAGRIPHIRVGTDYRINVPAWLEQLDRESKGQEN